MPPKKRTCAMCGADIGGIGQVVTYTGALIFGNKSRDPHVGPYCKNCVPPTILETKTVEYVKNCPITGEEWTPISNCITKHKRHPHTRIKCEFCLGRNPLRISEISCIHPDSLKERQEKKKARLITEAKGLDRM